MLSKISQIEKDKDHIISLYLRSKEQNTLHRNSLIDTENRLVGGGWGVSEEVKKYKLVVTELSQDVNYSVGNIVSNIVMTMYGVRWVLEILRGPLCKVPDGITTMLYAQN